MTTPSSGTKPVGGLIAVAFHAPVIRQALENHQPCDVHMLSELTKLHKGQIRYALRKMVAAGVVVRDGGQGHHHTTYRLA